MKKIVLPIFLLALILLSACGETQPSKTLQGRVEIFTEDTSVLSEVVTTGKETAEEVLIEACQEKKLPYTLTNNMFDNFGGIASTQTDGWILYINGELAQTGAYEVMLEDNFLIEFKYVNYDMVFGQQ